jgi:hypothetical protein
MMPARIPPLPSLSPLEIALAPRPDFDDAPKEPDHEHEHKSRAETVPDLLELRQDGTREAQSPASRGVQ